MRYDLNHTAKGVLQAIPEGYDSEMDWDIFQIRQRNLASKLADYRTQEEFSEVAEVSVSLVSQILNFHKNMGDKIARRIEKNLGLKHGYMDVIHWEEAVSETPANYVTPVTVWDARIESLPAELKKFVTKLTTEKTIQSLTAAEIAVLSSLVDALISRK